MTTSSRNFTAGSRALGEGARATTLFALLAATLAYGFDSPDLIGAGLLAVLLLLPRGFALFVWFRRMNPTVASGILGLCLLLPLLDYGLVSHEFGKAFAHLAGILAVWRFQHPRLTGRDHRFLLGISLFLVLMGLAGGGRERDGLLLLYGLAAIVALFRLHLAVEEGRVLDLARVPGFLRDEAEEVVGREGVEPAPLAPAVGSLAVWILAGGLLLAWLTPGAVRAVTEAFRYLGSGDVAAAEVRPPLPEIEDPGPPPFAIPPGAIAPVAFGPRFEREEFLYRIDTEDALALLIRRADRGRDGPDLLIRGECYDFLTSEGVWIRARSGERRLFDGEDGATDGWVRFERGETPVTTRDILVTPSSDRTLYGPPPLLAVRLPRLLADGAGNRFFPPEDRSRRARIESVDVDRWNLASPEDPGPEFSRLPAGCDADALLGELDPLLAELDEPAMRVRAIRDWLMSRCVRFEGEEAPPGVRADEAPVPREFDPVGFLTTRRWGRNPDFATAFAVLLRAAGIPCRLATGYRGGIDIEETDFRVCRSWHAWAWVEVPFVGAGWVPFDASPREIDPLPAEVIEKIFEAPPEERPAAAATALERAARKSLPRRAFETLDRWISSILPGNRESSPLGRIFAALVLAVLFGLVLRAAMAFAEQGYRFVSRRQKKRPGELPVVPFYDRLVRLLARYGMRRRPSQTPVEFAQVVVGTWGPDFKDVGRLTNAFCACRYGHRPLPPPVMDGLTRRVETLEQTLSERRGDGRSARRRIFGGSVLLAAALFVATAVAGPPPEAAVERLGEPRSDERRFAMEALTAMGGEAVPALRAVFAPPEAPDSSGKIAGLVRDLDSDDFRTREAATVALLEIGEPARPALVDVAANGTPEASRRARKILAGLDAAAGTANPEEAGRASLVRERLALLLLGRLGGSGEVDLVAAVGLERTELADWARRAMGALARRRPEPVLALLSRPDPALRRFAALALGRAGIETALPFLLQSVDDPDERVRRAVRDVLVTPQVIEDTEKARRLVAAGRGADAVPILDRVLGLCPGHPAAGRLRIEIHFATGSPRDALRVAERLWLPPAEKELLAAKVLAAAGDREAARARLHDAARLAPADPEPLFCAAELDLGAKPPRLSAAIEALREATKRAPYDARGFARLGKVHEEQAGSRAEAAACYERALELDPGNGDYEQAWLRCR